MFQVLDDFLTLMMAWNQHNSIVVFMITMEMMESWLEDGFEIYMILSYGLEDY